MVYFGIFLVLIAAGLWWASIRFDSLRSAASQTEPGSTRFIPVISASVAAVMVAVVGIFLIATNLTGM